MGRCSPILGECKLSTCLLTVLREKDQILAWSEMVAAVVNRYVAAYGLDAVAKWRFESW